MELLERKQREKVTNRMKGKRKLYKILSVVAACGMLLAGMPSMPMVLAAENTQTVSAQMPFREMSVDEMVAEMGNGWNLGNTMDGHTGFTPSETIWQSVETTQALMKAVHDAGFNTVRVPVTWGNMIDDENNFAIDEAWMSRVQDIVDYAVNMNMYVIVNIHHDGAEQTGWLRVGADDIEPVKVKFEAVWKQIAERFKDYDEHVIFESMNEVTGDDGDLAGDTAVINELNQLFVDTVRSTGSNNALRWLSVPGRYTNIVNTTKAENGFKLPDDSVDHRLFVAVHYYDWQFGLLETVQTTEFSDNSVKNLIPEFMLLEKTFTSKGIPVILGEYGAVNKNNTKERAYHMEVVNRLCQQIGIVPCYWDNGWYDLSLNPDFAFTLIDRATGEHVYPEIIAAMMRGFFHEGKTDLTDIQRETTVKPITNLGTAKGTYLLHMGEVIDVSLAEYVDKKASNDVVLWKSADETVATVNQDASDLSVWAANIHATGIGNTVITAYSYEGQAVLEIPVEVQAAVTRTPCTDIQVEQDAYALVAGQSVFMNATMLPENTDAFLTYRSSNPDVVSVSKLGKLVAKQDGSAIVVITSSDGMTKVVPVTVEAAEATAEIELALNVYYNDSALNYFSNEFGKSITVSEDGQYTLSFDCATDLSDNAVKTGVIGLSNLTAVYIKDHSVTTGKAKKSPLVSCDIIYDKVVVDGTELSVTMAEPKSALKASGIFDTNDPLNSWDGSVVEEVEVHNHVLNFLTLENPQKVEVTFTISNLVFEEGATAIEPAKATAIKMIKSSLAIDTKTPGELSVEVTPADAAEVTYVSSNAAIASVSNVVQNGNGTTLSVYGHQAGETVITAYTNNGLIAEVKVTVTEAADKTYANVETPAIEDKSTIEDKTTIEDKSTIEDAQTEQTTHNDSVENEADADEKAETKSSAQSSPMNTVFLVMGILVFGVVVFLLTLKIAGGTGKKK